MFELLHYCKDGSTIWVDFSMFPLEDREGVVTHSTFGREAHAAFHDPLAGLANRAQFVDRVITRGFPTSARDAGLRVHPLIATPLEPRARETFAAATTSSLPVALQLGSDLMIAETSARSISSGGIARPQPASARGIPS